MQRWAAGIEYLGTRYGGWQAQSTRASIQAELEVALTRVAAHPVQTQAAGRTDAGVHAYGQVVHFDSDAARKPYAWLLGANTALPADISLRWVHAVDSRFNARRSACARSYRYVIHNDRGRSALLMDRAAWITPPLDAQAMHAAAQALVGEHDFSGYRSAECQSHSVMRHLQSIAVRRQGTFVVLDVCANAFLHHMVRNITGTLFEIGMGRKPVTWASEILQGRDRSRGGMTAPAQGLYFLGPEYPAHFGLPPAAQAWFPP